MKKEIDQKKTEELQGQFSLSLILMALTFCILLIAVVLTAVALYLLAYFRVIHVAVESIPDIRHILIFMAVISLLVGAVLSLMASRIPLKPIRRMTAQMNRLASGDFRARLQFAGKLGRHPTFSCISDSFNKMAQELGNTEMLRADFVNNFSHEFKTPIVSIAGFAKLLKYGNLTEEQRQEYVDIIEEESLRLADMATNVLNMTKVENQTILTDVSTFNLSEQIRSAVLLLENKWDRKHLELVPEFDEYDITANEELLKQVWINLIDNAVKFSPEGGTVEIRIEPAEKVYAVSISNHGRHISPEEREKIFRKFYQADESHTGEGNGVGLAIVKRVVELHGGRVGIVSLPQDSGEALVTFTVAIPKDCKV